MLIGALVKLVRNQSGNACKKNKAGLNAGCVRVLRIQCKYPMIKWCSKDGMMRTTSELPQVGQDPVRALELWVYERRGDSKMAWLTAERHTETEIWIINEQMHCIMHM